MAIAQTEHIVQNHPVVSREEWLEARRELLAKEKELTRLMDAVSAARRELPWVKIEKTYTFQTPEGEKALEDLFDGRSQLIIYHFMFGPGWKEGCNGCSFLADHFDGANLHLAHHDVSLVAVSRGSLEEFEPFKRRMGWKFPWVSSANSDFNFDFHVSFTKESMAAGNNQYNFAPRNSESEAEGHGVSVFYRDKDGTIYHTWSGYARGIEILLGAHNFLDLTPLGRNEKSVMDWVRHHDKYEAAKPDPCGCSGSYAESSS